MTYLVINYILGSLAQFFLELKVYLPLVGVETGMEILGCKISDFLNPYLSHKN